LKLSPRRLTGACVLATTALAAAQENEKSPWQLREIRITTRNIYSDEDAAENVVYRLLNILHIPTKVDVVRREMWFAEGDIVTTDTIEELESILRAFGKFGAASAALVPTGEPGVADLEVDTRDRLSLILAARPSFVGGVTGFTGIIGESNLFGLGKRFVVAGDTNSDGEQSIDVSYDDPQVLESWYRLHAEGAVTEEGYLAAFDLTRPFKHLEDPLSYGVNAESLERDVDYFDHGESVAEVPLGQNDGRVFVSHAFGPRDLRGTVGADLAYRQSDYSPAKGTAAAQIRVPGDATRGDLGVFGSVHWVDSYLKLQGVDTFDYVEDETLGASGDLRVGGALRDEEGASSELQPVLSGSARTAIKPVTDTYLTLESSGTARWYGGETKGWRFSGAAHAFQTSLPRQTLAASLTLDAAVETQDLQPQFTLGEDNGLRGYPAREFAGTRFVRLNLEDRIDTGLDVLSVHVGVAVFFDSGWVHGAAQGLSQGESIKSTGIGLRFGSSEILGANIVRVDFAQPLDTVGGEDYGFSVSFAVGQVFSFFGNTNELVTEF
jgi:hypothetical protein